MSAKICPLCQINLALEPSRQLKLFGTTYQDENGEPLCLECIEESPSEVKDHD